MNWHHLRYFIRTASASVISAPVVQLVAVSTITLALSVFCVVLVVTTNVENLTERWGRGLGIVAFLGAPEGADRPDLLIDKVQSWPEVQTVLFRSRSEALADLRVALSGDAHLLDGIDSDLLPASIEIVLVPSYRSEAHRAKVAARLSKASQGIQIEEVDFGVALLAKIRAAQELIRLGGFVIGCLVLFAVIFIISNTVRLALFARREEIEVMSLVGATNHFVRIPFYLEGAFQGMSSAMIALFLTWMGFELLPLTGFFSDILQSFPRFEFLKVSTMALLVLGTAAVGILASHLAASRYLKGRHD